MTPKPSILVVMGVSGSGKTTLAGALRDRLGWLFQEGDDLHPPANVEKMRAGHPLDDADRAPWLARIAEWIGARITGGEPAIITCSALKHAYRDVIAAGRQEVCFVYLDVPREELQARLARRQHHYMPASLLDSQLATLEPLTPEERAVTIHPASTDDMAAAVIDAIERP